MAKKRYSRLKRVEKKKNLRSAVIFGVMTVAFVALMFFFGLPALVKFAAFLTNIRGSTQSIEILDDTPPPPPRVESLPEYVNDAKLTVNGNTEAGATVKIYVNDEVKEVIADNEGRFTSSVLLENERSAIYALSIDTAGNESAESREQIVFYDTSDPELVISEPSDGQEFRGSESRITIKGNVSEDASVSINDRIAIVDSSGQFLIDFTLEEGENKFSATATDEAGNQSVEEFTVKYLP